MRVPKREDQSLFISPLIVRQLSSQSIILDQVQLSYEYYTRSVGFVNPFYKFFSKWRRRESNPRLRWFRHAAFPESTTKYTPDKKKTVRAGQTLPRNYHRTLSILDEDLTPHQDLLFTLYMYKDYRA